MWRPTKRTFPPGPTDPGGSVREVSIVEGGETRILHMGRARSVGTLSGSKAGYQRRKALDLDLSLLVD